MGMDLSRIKLILKLLRDGMDYRDAICEYPWITPEMIHEALDYSLKLVENQIKIQDIELENDY